MKTGHTEGGWHRNIPPAAKYPIIFAGRNTHVAQVLSRGLPESEIEANCNLIAAAPALLEALRDLIDYQASHGTLDTEDGTPLIDKGHAAVRLAFGIYHTP